MKQMRRAMRVISLCLLLAFLGTGVYLGYTVFSQGSRLVTNQYNSRISTAKKNTSMGDITDRTGLILATTDQDGNRQYASSEATRRALSQTVGDQMSMSGTGVETFHAGTLLGFSGSIIDRTWQFLTGGEYVGDNIQLTVSAELATYISEQFPSGKEGAVVVINYATGEILAMVSKPDYDPARLLSRQSGADDTGSGYLNRCLQGRYTPGSVFKIVTLAAALDNLPSATSSSYVCEGSRQFGDGKVTCFGGTVHGEMSLREAFSNSCNVTFAALSTQMGASALIRTAQNMGFNDNFSFRDLILYESSIPTDLSDTNELAWTGVGQGRLLVTPLHMAMIAGAVANGGVMREPVLIKQITGASGLAKLRSSGGVYTRALSEQTASVIGAYMRRTVESGTATKAAVKGLTICGKTGSAETSDDKRVETDAWFVGYIDSEETPYAIAVVVEQGGTGGSVAAPLAAKALKKAASLIL